MNSPVEAWFIVMGIALLGILGVRLLLLLMVVVSDWAWSSRGYPNLLRSLGFRP
jgi:hypothetical protein